MEHPVVHIFSTDLPGEKLRELEALLSDPERERAGQFHFEADRARFVASRGKLRTILGDHLSRSPGSIEFAFGMHGKPVVKGHPDDIEFSLSRSRDVGVVVVAHQRSVGVDIELLRPFDDALQVARNRFRPAEAAAIDSASLFFQLWTRKEAVAKCLGWGLTLPFDVFEVDPSIPPSGRVLVDHQGERSEIQVEALRLDAEGIVGAIARLQ
jgi:4'-phosphopantetheinyl transferase